MTQTLAGVGQSIGSAAGKAGESVGTVAQKAKTPALVGTVAAAGLAGGMALGSRMFSRPKVAKVPVRRSPASRAMKSMTGKGGAFKSVANEVQQVGKEIGKAGFRMGVGDVSMEVKRGDKEQRDSPLEVLLHGLTNRRSKRK